MYNPGQLPGSFQPHAVGVQLPPPAPEKPGFQGKVPVPAKHQALYKSGVHAQHNHLFVVPGPVGPGRRQIGHSLQQVGLSLGVVPVDQVDPVVKAGLQVGVIAEKVQLQMFDNHVTTSSVSPSMTARSPGRSFFPRMAQPSPLTATRPS